MFKLKIFILILFKKFLITKGKIKNFILKLKKKYLTKYDEENNNHIFYLTRTGFCSTINTIKNIFTYINSGFVFSLYIKGLGYNLFKIQNKLKINLSFSHSVLFLIPANLNIIINKEIIYLYGYCPEIIMKYSTLLSFIRKKNKYKEVGILRFDKKCKYKLGKQKK